MSLSAERNVTQTLDWVHSTAGLRARCQVGQRPRGECRTAGEVKGELPF